MSGQRIIIAGGFGLPDRNASAIRAVGLAKLFAKIGYAPLLLGKFESVPNGSDFDHVKEFNGVELRDLRKPFSESIVSDYVSRSDGLRAVVNRIGAEQVDAVILYNYPIRGILGAYWLCRRARIPLILDLSEWYGWEGSKIIRNVIRVVSSETRMRVLSRLVGNVMCTSSHMRDAVKAKNSLILPFVVDPTEERWSIRRGMLPHSDIPRRLVYSGSPGLGMHKDRLPYLFDALSVLPDDIHFSLDIFGITEREFLEACPGTNLCRERVGSTIRFYGRVSHDRSLDALSAAHYSVFFRKSNRVSNMGFPTKYMEATTLGSPVITNGTSDIATYCGNGINGIIAASESREDIVAALIYALTMSAEDYEKMRVAQFANNPFSIENWTEIINEFLAKAKSQKR